MFWSWPKTGPLFLLSINYVHSVTKLLRMRKTWTHSKKHRQILHIHNHLVATEWQIHPSIQNEQDVKSLPCEQTWGPGLFYRTSGAFEKDEKTRHYLIKHGRANPECSFKFKKARGREKKNAKYSIGINLFSERGRAIDGERSIMCWAGSNASWPIFGWADFIRWQYICLSEPRIWRDSAIP